MTDVNKRLLNKLIGSPNEFSMENRAFSFISLITFPLLIFCLIWDLSVSPTIMSLVITVLIFIQGFVYYYSRYKKTYQSVIFIYAIVGYVALIINYYTDTGVNGGTLFFFFLTLNFFIAFSPPKRHLWWLIFHLLIVITLLYTEYLHPEWIHTSYQSRASRFIDIGISYTLTISFVFAVTHFLRRYFTNERTLSEGRAISIIEQNEQILIQNKLLETLNDEKNKLFSIISHDLRSPLDSIKGYLEILSQNTLTNEEKTEMEAELIQQTKYTSDLLVNLLSWSKAQMQGITVHLTPMYLKEIVEAATMNKTGIAAKKGIKLICSLDPNIKILCDRDMMRIVLRNLVNNAIKFTPSGGEITITIYEKEGNAEVSIQDTGIGISVEKQEDIFTLKTRSTFGTNNEKGIGLGLIMCKQFMEYQQGNIRFDSRVGQGTIFYISLPLAGL